MHVLCRYGDDEEIGLLLDNPHLPGRAFNTTCNKHLESPFTLFLKRPAPVDCTVLSKMMESGIIYFNKHDDGHIILQKDLFELAKTNPDVRDVIERRGIDFNAVGNHKKPDADVDHFPQSPDVTTLDTDHKPPPKPAT